MLCVGMCVYESYSKTICPVTQSNLSKHLVKHECSYGSHTRNTGIPLKDIVIQLPLEMMSLHAWRAKKKPDPPLNLPSKVPSFLNPYCFPVKNIVSKNNKFTYKGKLTFHIERIYIKFIFLSPLQNGNLNCYLTEPFYHQPITNFVGID